MQQNESFGKWHDMLVGGALVIIGALLMLAWIRTGPEPDYTMSDAQAKAYCQQKPVIIYTRGTAEDDFYIQPEDIGRVDLR